MRLSYIISQTTRLSRLEWLQRVDHPPPQCLLDAITGIRTLSTVKLGLNPNTICEILSRMESRPHTIMCKAHDSFRFFSDTTPLRNVHQALSKFAHAGSVHSITLEVGQTITLGTTKHLGEVVPWPSIKNLMIHGHSSGSLLDLSLLSYNFPGMERLRLVGDAEDFTSGPFAWSSVNFMHTAFPVHLTTAVRHVILESDHAPRALRGGLFGTLDRLCPSVLKCEANPNLLFEIAQSGHSIKFLQLHAGASGYDNALEAYTSVVCIISIVDSHPHHQR